MQGSSGTASSITPDGAESPEQVAPSMPERLGKYQLVRRLARGGMGEVHLAKLAGELGFEKLLVVKTIRSELAADPRFVELFASEAKTAVALSHPNITPIYELGRAEDGSLYTAMGWVDGPSLAQWIERLRGDDRRFDLGAALLITRELLDGLAHAHSRDHGRPPVVHRDINPRNVLVDRSGRVQIVDFGIAKPVDAEVLGLMGSIGYMAPEQARGDPVDPRADVFSVGCVLFELLTLEQAFPREGVWMLPDVRALPVELQGLLARALALDPAERFADAHEFLRRLAPIQAELAPTYATPDLAAALREQFSERGWTEADTRSRHAATPSTHVTPVHRTVAFASRDTLADERGDDTEQADASDEPSEEVAITVDPRPAPPRRVHPMIWAFAGAAAASILVVLASNWIDPEQPELAPGPTSADERVLASAPEPAPEPARDSTRPREPPPPLPAPTDPPPDTTRTLEITVAPETAELTLDGQAVAGPPYRLALTRPVELELRAAGHRTRVVELDPSDPASQHFDLEPLGEGQLTVLAPAVAWAEVWLDGEKLGSTPLTDFPVIEGRHKLEVRCTAEVCEGERVLARKSVQIRAGRRLEVTASD